jgi:protease-4
MKTPTLKNTFLLIVLSSLAVSSFGQDYSQQHGYALDDDSLYLESNPAALGFNRDYGLEYSNLTDGEMVLRQRVTASSPLGLLGWEQQGGDQTLSYDFGLELLPDTWAAGYASAYDLEGNQMTDVSVGTQIRPLNFFSAGAVYGQTMGTDYAYAGVGLRPLAFLQGWEHRLTLFGDFNIMDPRFLGAGINLEPLDGLRVGAVYDYSQESWAGKLSFNLGQLTASAWSDLNQVESSVKLSFVPAKGLLDFSPEKIIEIKGAEVLGEGPSFGFFGGLRSYQDFISEIKGYAEDSSVKALVFVNQPMISSSAVRIEIIEALQSFKDQGKKIYMHFDGLDLWGYGIAAAVADHISLAKLGFLDVRHFSSTQLYFKNLLAEWGITVNKYNTGVNKSAGNAFTEESMPLEVQESLRTRLSLLQKAFVELVTVGRGGKLTDSIENIIAAGPYLYGQKALDAGLIDGANSEAVFLDYVQKEYPDASWQSFTPSTQSITKWGPDLRDRIAVVYATGSIVYGPGLAGESIGSDSMVELLDQLAEDSRIKGIVLRIDSPGGSALASDIIAEKVIEISQGDKPIVVSMGGLAASGGYYIAAPADYIFAGRTTLTGSIGVVALTLTCRVSRSVLT